LAVEANNATSGALADPNPILGTATFYVANAVPAGVLNGAFGCVNPGTCFMGPTPNVSCATDSNCGASGTCLNLGQAGALQSDGCPTANPSLYKVNSSAEPTAATVCWLSKIVGLVIDRGACCIPGRPLGTCFDDTSPFDCKSRSGQYQGIGSTCITANFCK
jgi:hypothetical protein